MQIKLPQAGGFSYVIIKKKESKVKKRGDRERERARAREGEGESERAEKQQQHHFGKKQIISKVYLKLNFIYYKESYLYIRLLTSGKLKKM